jgi:hypothetical protein
MLNAASDIIDALAHKDVKWSDAFEEIGDNLRAARFDPEVFEGNIGKGVGFSLTYPIDSTDRSASGRREVRYNKISRLAYSIYWLKQDINLYAGQDEDSRKENHEGAVKRFNRIACQNMLQNFPEVDDFSDETLPVLGPIKEWEEDFMEPYNRVYHLYNFLYYNSTARRREDLLDAKDGNQFQSKAVGKEWIPFFMRKIKWDVDDYEDEVRREACQDSNRYKHKVFPYVGAPDLDDNEDLFEYDGVPSMISDVFPELNTAERLRADAFSKSRYVHQSGCGHMTGSMFMD